MDHRFELPGSYRKWTLGLIIVGVLALLYGFIMFHPFAHAGHGENVNSTRFWAVLLQNSVYWLLTVNAAMFFICVTTMAMGGWQVAFRRVSEAISSVVPVLGIITFIILFLLLSRSIVVKTKFIEFFGILGLLAVFEFINLFIHPFLSRATNDSPVLMLAILIAIGALLIPLHHRMEKWITRIMVEKNKKIRLAAAKKTIEQLEGGEHPP